MNNKILIHVGYHKSGTTWLQNHLLSNNDFGLTCPWGNQASIAVNLFICINPFKFDPITTRKKLLPEIEKANSEGLVPVISNEALCGLEQPRTRYEKVAADRLKAVFPEAKILITLRKQNASILSHYKEYVSKGGSINLDKYLNGTSLPIGFFPHCQLDRFEYDLFVAYYIKLFGKDNVHIILQEEMIMDRQDICNSLANFLNINPFKVPANEKARIGWVGAALQYRRFCNKLGLGIPDWSKPKQSILFSIVNKVGIAVNAYTPEWINNNIDTRLRDTVEGITHNRFEESNRRLKEIVKKDLEKFGYKLAIYKQKKTTWVE